MATNVQLMPVAPPAAANALSNAVAAVDIRAVKPLVLFPNPWIWVWLGGALLAAAVVGGWAWRRWGRRVAAEAVPVVVVPAHVRARDQLKAALALLEQPKPFCIAVSDALRTYLEAQFQLRAPERTTEEFLLELQTSAVLDARHKETLNRFLERCDLVKFARQEPGRSELQQLHDVALRLVEETIPAFDVPGSEPVRPGGRR